MSAESDKGIAGSPFLNSLQILRARAFSRRLAGADLETRPIPAKVANRGIDWLLLLTWLLAAIACVGVWVVVGRSVARAVL